MFKGWQLASWRFDPLVFLVALGQARDVAHDAQNHNAAYDYLRRIFLAFLVRV
jgi:hypothetical protein